MQGSGAAAAQKKKPAGTHFVLTSLKLKGSISSEYLCYRETLEVLKITTNIRGLDFRYLMYTEIIMGLDITQEVAVIFHKQVKSQQKNQPQVTESLLITEVVNSIKVMSWNYLCSQI